MADLISGALLGVAAQKFLDVILHAKDRAIRFKTILQKLETTTKSLIPKLKEIDRLIQASDGNNLAAEGIKKLINLIEEAEKLVEECSEVAWWNYRKKIRHSKELQQMDVTLCRIIALELPVYNALMIGNVGEALKDLQKKLDQVMELQVKSNKKDHVQIARDDQEILWMKKNNETQKELLRGPPPKPTFTVGLGGHLNKLKTKLLKENVPVLLLTGLGGSGKTTLATEFCWDDEIIGYFKENIFFSTFTKNPKLKLIIETLFDQCGFEIEFQSDKEALNNLGILLGKILKGPKLLVLDDVFRGSEWLVEKLKDQLSDGKILLTSRIAYPRFGSAYRLEPLCDEDALKLFRHRAQLNDNSLYIPEEDLVRELVRGCKGLPFALELISGSLCQQPFEVWQKRKELLQRHSILQSYDNFRAFLQQFLNDVLEDKPIIKECFMDLGLFPEDQRIPVAALIDMWAELHEPDENGMNAVNIIWELVTKNLANTVVTRNVASNPDEYMYYNNHFVKLHDHPRDLAIYMSNQQGFEQRKRLIIHINGEIRPEWWVDEKPRGMISSVLSIVPRMISSVLSIVPRWLMGSKQQHVAARTLSISTDEIFTSDWCSLQPDEAEVLILNLHTAKYTFPKFLKKMRRMKVLIVTNYGSHHSELNKFELLGSLSDLKRIRLQKVSVLSLCKMKNLQKLSLYMCNINQAFQNCTIQISEALPHLMELCIDYCNDLVKLPADFCDIKPLKKLNITNSHKFYALPQDIGKLEYLEVLRLSSCTDLEKMPASITRLSKLRFLDISDCIKLTELPENMGELRNLEKICMSMGAYSRLHELPSSVAHLEKLKHVVCSEETAVLWKDLDLPNLKIEIPKADNNLNWLFGGSS